MSAASRQVMGVLVVIAPLGCGAAKPLKLYPGSVRPAESLAVVMTYSPSAYLHSVRGNGVYVGIHPHVRRHPSASRAADELGRELDRAAGR